MLFYCNIDMLEITKILMRAKKHQKFSGKKLFQHQQNLS